MENPHFIEKSGIFYIGENPDEFLFYNKEQKLAFFKDSKKKIITCDCQFFFCNFSGNYFEDKMERTLYFLTKRNTLIFEYVAETFLYFLEKNQCINPILASFLFTEEYVKYNHSEVPFILAKQYKYSNSKYSPVILHFFYFIFYGLYSSIRTSNYDILVENLKTFLKIIASPCSNEIKTIDDSSAIKILSKSIFKLENRARIFFNIIYFLLTNSTKVYLDSIQYGLIVFDDVYDIQFFSGLASLDLNIKSIWILPAIFLAIDPHKIGRKFNYNVPDFYIECIALELIYWENYKKEKKIYKLPLIMMGYRTEAKSLFECDITDYSKKLTKCEKAIHSLLDGANKQWKNDKTAPIYNELKSIDDNLDTFMGKKIQNYPYEDVVETFKELDNFCKKIALNCKTANDFWGKMVFHLDKLDITSRKTIISYLNCALDGSF